MIHFVVNNDIHYFDVSSQLSGLSERGARVVLIVVPVALRVGVDEAAFERVVTLESPYRSHLSETSRAHLRRTTIAIAERIPVGRGDIVVLYTDREPLNCVLASHFMRAGARVVMLEEGIASYLDVTSRGPVPMRLRARIKTFYARRTFGLRDASFVPQGPFLGSRLDDNVIAARLFYLRPTGYDPPCAIFVRHRFPQGARHGESTAVFCNQPLYGIYMSEANYLDALRSVIGRLVDGHERIVFKFHPRDSAAMKSAMVDALGRHGRMEFRESPLPIEREMDAIGAGVAYSFFSGALLTLAQMGHRVVFLYDAIRDRLEARTVVALDRFLLSLGCPSVKGGFPVLDAERLRPFQGTLDVGDVLQCLADGRDVGVASP